MKLKQVINQIPYTVLKGNLDSDIKGIAYDSRQVKPGFLFVCITGFMTDGHLYAEQAVAQGAVAVLAEREIDLPGTVTLVCTENTRLALPVLASNFYNEPSRDLRVIGVTGTNGKTTTTHLIQAILQEAGRKTGIMGTLYARIDDYEHEIGRTTPEALEIEEFMDIVRRHHGDGVVMEVSSHALDLGRVDKINFDVAVFTNLTQDHLDYHKTMEEYKNCKLKLFKQIPVADDTFCIINADDAYADDFINTASKLAYTYGINQSADVKAVNLKTGLKGTKFKVNYSGGSFDINIQLIGLFSVYNALAAIAFALREGIAPAVIKAALQKIKGVPGRFEQVDAGQDFTVIVDYAHTPDGLENILATAKQLVEKRLITVFGCGGDRDKTKRPLMGEIAARYSDFTVVTSDNPRSEEPQAIINDITPGVEKVAGARYAIIVDRREAIRHAVNLARKGDMVIIAGKGHETYQLVKGQVLDFDDRIVATEYLKGK